MIGRNDAWWFEKPLCTWFSKAKARQSHEVKGWLTVASQVPKLREQALVYMPREGRDGCIRWDRWVHHEGLCDGWLLNPGKVTHWMPLPAPPTTKGESE